VRAGGGFVSMQKDTLSVHVSTVFIDLLFAAVVSRILEEGTDSSVPLGPVGVCHLLVAAVLTILSWVGYHNSRKTAAQTGELKVTSLEFVVFFLDILIVVLYWVVTAAAEIPRPPESVRPPSSPSALPEAAGVAVSALIYIFWDFAYLLINRRNECHSPAARRAGRPPCGFRGLLSCEHHVDRVKKVRGCVTTGFAAVAVSVLVLVYYAEPLMSGNEERFVVAADAVLVCLLVAYRLMKEWLARLVAPAPAPEGPEAAAAVHSTGTAAAVDSLPGQRSGEIDGPTAAPSARAPRRSPRAPAPPRPG